jgi:hypothetical protein
MTDCELEPVPDWWEAARLRGDPVVGETFRDLAAASMAVGDPAASEAAARRLRQLFPDLPDGTAP